MSDNEIDEKLKELCTDIIKKIEDASIDAFNPIRTLATICHGLSIILMNNDKKLFSELVQVLIRDSI